MTLFSLSSKRRKVACHPIALDEVGKTRRNFLLLGGRVRRRGYRQMTYTHIVNWQ